MKKLLSCILAMILLASCALAVANPVVEVYDDDRFEDVLRIDIDADDLPSRDLEMSIIDGKLGQIVFRLENVNGETVNWTLRFTRDKGIAATVESFSGLYDTDMTEPETRSVDYSEDYDDPVIHIDLTSLRANTLGYDIYLWNHRGVSYCLTIDGDYSQMQFAEAMDRIFEACLDD